VQVVQTEVVPELACPSALLHLGASLHVGEKKMGGKLLEWAGAGQGLTVLLSRGVIVLG
jgi:hypothetical protein